MIFHTTLTLFSFELLFHGETGNVDSNMHVEADYPIITVLTHTQNNISETVRKYSAHNLLSVHRSV